MGNYHWEIGGIETTDEEAKLILDITGLFLRSHILLKQMRNQFLLAKVLLKRSLLKFYPFRIEANEKAFNVFISLDSSEDQRIFETNLQGVQNR